MVNALHDLRSDPTTVGDAATLDRFEPLLNRYLCFSGDPASELKALLADDPDFILGRCLKTGFLLYQHRRVLDGKVVKELDAIDALAVKPNARERGHIAALRAWAEGRLNRAADLWEQVLLDYPHDLLALKFSQDLRFFLGQGPQIRDGAARLLPAWSQDLPGYGFVLGMYAFGLEECADYGRAEDIGRQALALNPKDAWAVHAVTHVMEMQGRRDDGIAWLEQRQVDWAPDNFFAIHLWWHKTLFYFDTCRYEQVLALYDQQIRGQPSSSLLLHLLDAAAALWRLYIAEPHGHGLSAPLAERAQTLADELAPLADNAISAFNDSHAMMAFALAGREYEAQILITALDQLAKSASDADNAAVTRHTGLAVCRALWAFSQGDYHVVVELLSPIRYAFPALGGSHAQRDVYQLTLIEAALRSKQATLAQALLAERSALRPNSAHDRRLHERLAALA